MRLIKPKAEEIFLQTVSMWVFQLKFSSIGQSGGLGPYHHFLTKADNVFFSIYLTCDQASLYFRSGKVRLIQLLDYLSVASPESGLFSDWSRNKRYLELSHNWFPACQSRWLLIKEILRADEFHHDIWWGEQRERVFVSSKCFPESFVHKALKDEQIECIHRIVYHGRDVLAVLPTGLGRNAIYQTWISKVLYVFNFVVQPTPHQKPLQNSLFFVGLQSGMVPSPSSASETNSLRKN